MTIFDTYHCEIQMRNRILGGTPGNPKLVEGWIRSKAGVTKDEEVREMVIRTMQQMGMDVDPNKHTTMEELIEISKSIGSETVNGFKRDEHGLYVEDRQPKAMLKESISILFPGGANKWGATKKAPNSYFAERVFFGQERIYLGVHDATGIHQMTGRVGFPPRSVISYYEYVARPKLEFYLRVVKQSDDIRWADVMEHASENGLGANRSQSNGRFDVLKFKKVRHEPREIIPKIKVAKGAARKAKTS